MPIKQIVVPNQQSTLRRSLAARCCCRPRFCCTIHNSIYPVPDGKLLLTNTQQQKGDTKSPSSPAKLRRLILLVSRFPANNIYFMITSWYILLLSHTNHKSMTSGLIMRDYIPALVPVRRGRAGEQQIVAALIRTHASVKTPLIKFEDIRPLERVNQWTGYRFRIVILPRH